MNKLPQYLLTLLVLFGLLAISYFAIIYFFDHSTSAVLKSYEQTKNAEPVRNHLLEYRGEAEGTETRIEFVSWGIKHPEDFISIVEGIANPKKGDFCKIIGFTVVDSGQKEEFEEAFREQGSECIEVIRSEMGEQKR